MLHISIGVLINMGRYCNTKCNDILFVDAMTYIISQYSAYPGYSSQGYYGQQQVNFVSQESICSPPLYRLMMAHSLQPKLPFKLHKLQPKL